MGCLLVVMAGAFPRFVLFVVWILRPARVGAAFDAWIWPLLGLIFFPLATLLYVVLYMSGRDLGGWEWFWIAVAGLFDITHWAAAGLQGRQKDLLLTGTPPPPASNAAP